jgi:uncharacterized SAM-binding protein YcdF (DUF218 family)
MDRRKLRGPVSRPAADAVVVLGAQVLGPGAPAPAARRRVAHGVEVLAGGGARWLVLTGGVGEAGVSEASVMAEVAAGLGVTRDRLVLEEESTSTLEQAIAVARLARRRGWRRVVVVTDRYHLPRALFLFRRMGLPAAGDPARGPGGAGRWHWLGGVAREGAAWAKVAIQALDGTLGRAAEAARQDAPGAGPG